MFLSTNSSFPELYQLDNGRTLHRHLLVDGAVAESFWTCGADRFTMDLGIQPLQKAFVGLLGTLRVLYMTAAGLHYNPSLQQIHEMVPSTAC
jgi:hypothetical protein